MNLKKHADFLIPSIFFMFCLLLALGVEVNSNKTLTKKDLHEKITEVESFNKETITLMDQYSLGKLTAIYFSEQIGQLQKKLISTNEVLQKNKVGEENMKGLKLLSSLTSKQAFIIEALKDKKASEFGNEKKEFKEIEEELEKLSKKYE